MNSQEKEISYTSVNSYSTLNMLTADTKTIWFVCHGMGYLSRYFLKYFRGLNANKNYIIAPQAPSKYYQQPKLHVGANWLTKDNTEMGTENIMQYFDAIFEAEKLPQHLNFIVFGYSQGVSVAARYIAKRQLQCKQLIFHSGGIPKELIPKDFEFLHKSTKVKLVYGTKDQYLDNTRIIEESNRAKSLFGDRLSIHPFEGKHEVHVDFIENHIL